MAQAQGSQNSGPFQAPESSGWDNLATSKNILFSVVLAVKSVADLTVGKLKLGPIGTLISATKAFDYVKNIETGHDRTTDDPLVKVIIQQEGIGSEDAKKMRFPLNDARLLKLIEAAGGAGWQTNNFIYAWHPDQGYIPVKTGRILYRKGDGGVQMLFHSSLMSKAATKSK